MWPKSTVEGVIGAVSGRFNNDIRLRFETGAKDWDEGICDCCDACDIVSPAGPPRTRTTARWKSGTKCDRA